MYLILKSFSNWQIESKNNKKAPTKKGTQVKTENILKILRRIRNKKANKKGERKLEKKKCTKAWRWPEFVRDLGGIFFHRQRLI